jgi:acetyl-CoA C-acetyltransferase
MRAVSIVGIGKTPFGAFPDKTILDLAVEAGRKCLKDGNADPGRVEAFYLGNFAGPGLVGQNHLAPYVASGLGLGDIPATRFEAACGGEGRGDVSGDVRDDRPPAHAPVRDETGASGGGSGEESR